MTTIPLPWIKPPLSLNDRQHWRAKAATVKSVRATATLLARSYRPTPRERAIVTLHYRPRDNRRRDNLNLAATLKPITDGLVDAGVLTRGDSSAWVDERCRIHPPDGPPAMWLTITDPDDPQEAA